MRGMKIISLSDRSRHKILSIEAPGCIVNIRIGLTDAEGQNETGISIIADGDRYSGSPEWWIEGDKNVRYTNVCVVQTTKPSRP